MTSINQVKEGKTASGRSIAKFFLNYGVFFAMLLLVIIYTCLSKNFLTWVNLLQLLRDSNQLLLICVGLTFVMLTGDLDVSVGSVAALAATVWVLSIEAGVPIIIATLLSVIAGAAIGTFNGLMIVYARVESFLGTLGMMLGLRGIVFLATKNKMILLSPEIKAIAQYPTLQLPLVALAGIVFVILMQFVLKHTKYGRKIVAIGCNPKTARVVGINVKVTKLLAYTICGIFAGLGGIAGTLNVGCLTAAHLGVGIEFTAIMAIILGGTSVTGGYGSIFPGTLCGVLFIYIIENGLALTGANVYIYPLVRGIVIFAAMYVDSMKVRYAKNFK
jgi:Ribose/xylose/arabinose/galactoside ABC-type transport systems, permease components